MSGTAFTAVKHKQLYNVDVRETIITYVYLTETVPDNGVIHYIIWLFPVER